MSPSSAPAAFSIEWQRLHKQIVNCRRCPRLVAFREQIGIEKRRAFRDQAYWSRPLPGFGDPQARLVVIGLAPAAHGGNRTGRVFTGDRSADFLIRALFEAGFANQPTSIAADDGLKLQDAFITLPVRCAPPDNKPTKEETLTCENFFTRELALLHSMKVIVPLGGIALNAYLSSLVREGHIRSRAPFRFAHGAEFRTHEGGPQVLVCYHPSQQNTSTGKLTAEMLRTVFLRAREMLSA